MGAMFSSLWCYFNTKSVGIKCLKKIIAIHSPIILFSYSEEFHRVFIDLSRPTLSYALDYFLDSIPSFRISCVPTSIYVWSYTHLSWPSTPWKVIFALTVWKSYKSCALPHLVSIGTILTGLYLLVTTVKMLKGTTTIIEVLMRDSQCFSTASHRVLGLNTFDSPGILYYVGEKTWLTSSSWFPHSNRSQSSHHLCVSRAFPLSFLGANIDHFYVAACLVNILFSTFVPYTNASYLAIELMKSLQASMCSR